MRSLAFSSRGILLFSLLAASALPATAIELEQFTANVYAVRAQGAQSRTGTGVVIGAGQLVTACNLLAGARTIAVVRENVSYEATLAAPDTERNLCLLKVPNLPGNGVSMPAGSVTPGLGQKLVISAVSGQAVAMRTSTVVGLQAGNDGKLSAIELSATAEASANGGALFDESGRLAGILVSDNAAAANVRQRAVPAAWVREISARGAKSLATYQAAAPADNTLAKTQPAVADKTADNTADGGSPRVGEVWQYVLTDKLTRKRTDVSYRVDRVEKERVIFNQGARIERLDGTLDRIVTPVAGEFDIASPPAGWVPAGLKPGSRWKYSYRQSGSDIQTDLEGSVIGEAEVSVPSGTYHTIRILYRGYIQRPMRATGLGPATSQQYKAYVWYAPDLRRIVRFEASTAQVSETLELAAHRVE